MHDDRDDDTGGAHDAYRVALTDALRAAADPVEAQAVATHVLGDHLGAGRVVYGEADPGSAETFTSHREYRRDPAMPTSLGRHRWDDFGAYVATEMRAGRTLVVRDVRSHPGHSADDLAAYEAVGIRAYLAVPLVREGRIVAYLAVNHAAPRAWTAGEVALVEETAERTWAAVERARAEAALRASEARYRTLFESIEEGFVIAEVICDAAGRAVDALYLEGNPAASRLTGVPDYSRRRLSDVMPGAEPYWLEVYDRVARTGVAERLERYLAPAERWYDFHVSRVRDGAPGIAPDGPPRVAVVFQDVTERRRAEAALRESEARQRYLVRLGDALRPLADAAEIQETAARVLGEHLGAARAMYAEVEGEPGAEVGTLRGQYHAPGFAPPSTATPFPARYRYDAFGERVMALRRRGETMVVADVARDARFGAAERAAWEAGGVRAAVTVPLVRDGRFVCDFGVQSAAPREWTADEVALVEATAERTWAAVERARAETALREGEERFRLFAEASSDVLWMRDAERLRWEYLSPAFETIYGYPRSEVMGPDDLRHWADLVEPEDREGALAALERVRGGERVTFEYRVRRADGEIRWLRNTDFPIRDASGRVRRIGGIGRDVTEQRRRAANQALLVDISADLGRLSTEEEIVRTVGAKLAARLKLACYHYVDVDEERGEVTVRHFWHALDVPSTLGTFPIGGFVTPEGLETRRAGVTSVVHDVQRELTGDTAVEASLKAGAATQKIGAFVAVPYSQDGRWKAYFAAADSLPRRWTAAEVELIQEVASRVFPRIERVRAEAALRESEARAKALVATLPGAAAFIVDHALRYRLAEGEAFRDAGFTPEQFVGHTVEEAVGPALAAEYAPGYRRVLGGGSFEAEHDAHGRTFLTRGTPLRDAAGRVTAALFVSVDVTTRHAAEAALRELNEALERRVEERTAELVRADAARRHVLRQLVTAEEDERRRVSRELHDSLGQLVTALLLGLKALPRGADGDRSRIEDLERLADRIAREMHDMAVQLRPPALDNLGLRLALHALVEEWSQRYGVEGDFHSVGVDGERFAAEVETTLYRVVQEGLNNVVKHAGATRVSLVLERRNGMVGTILEDDGRGFDVDATLASPDKARRLGLRGMRERVALLGGELEIESTEGAGTTLYVRIPLPAEAE